MVAQLKPCPFCGGYPHPFTSMGQTWVRMRCHRCEMQTRAFESEVEAITAWNRRAAQQPTQEG